MNNRETRRTRHQIAAIRTTRTSTASASAAQTILVGAPVMFWQVPLLRGSADRSLAHGGNNARPANKKGPGIAEALDADQEQSLTSATS
jgi:hypothetical protein